MSTRPAVAYSITDEVLVARFHNLCRTDPAELIRYGVWLARGGPTISSVDELRVTEASRVARPVATATTPLVEVEVAELRRDAEPTQSVHLSKTARGEILAECARWPNVETGGWLISTERPRAGQRTYIADAGAAATDRKRAQVMLMIDEFERDEATIKHFSGDHLRTVGNWHTHPAGWAIPSSADLASWARLVRRSNLSQYTTLIVAPNTRWGDWDNPLITAWVTSIDRHDRVVCEPAQLT
jgi:proteasome lid subunit RPN8/RPN11